MLEPNRPLKVFLCHASADKPAVRNLYKRLVADGVDAWLDAESLVAGQNWQVEIPKAIRESDVVLVCLSERSINKEGYVQREIKFSLDIADEKPEGTIFIIPTKLEECKIPDRLNMYHWVELFDGDGYERLMQALRLRADRIDATLQIKKRPLKVKNNLTRNFIFFVLFVALTLVSIFGLPSLMSGTESVVTSISTINVDATVNSKTPVLDPVVIKTLIPTLTFTATPTVTMTPTYLASVSCTWFDKYNWIVVYENGEKKPVLIDVRWTCNCSNSICQCEMSEYVPYRDGYSVLSSTQKDRDWVNLQVKNMYGRCEGN